MQVLVSEADLEARRAPHGARGLKFIEVDGKTVVELVAPRMGRVD